MGFIPVNEPDLKGKERNYLVECVDTGWISSEGPFVKRLEAEMAHRAGRRYGIAVCNGSAALDIAVAALSLGAGDEVILPTFTIISCAAAIVRSGAIPVVVDADPFTWNMDVNKIAALITPRTRAIMVVHIYGLPVDMDPIIALAQRHALKIIEDSAEAIGQDYKGKACGSFGDISTLSFYPNKHVTTGEGGMLMTDDSNLAERCRSLRNLCFQERRFVHEDLGWNFRMSNVQAALGVAQLERLKEFVERKRRMGRRYHELLHGIRTLQLPLEGTAYAENIYWVFGVVLSDELSLDADAAMKELSAAGVGTRPFFWPMHEQPVFRRMGLFQGVRCPVAERIARRGFYLPSGLALNDEQLSTVCSVLRALVEEKLGHCASPRAPKGLPESAK
jgi:perosamine synthetase